MKKRLRLDPEAQADLDDIYYHIIFYRPIDGGIEVARVLHGARDWPALFLP